MAYVEGVTTSGTTISGVRLNEANWTSYNKFAEIHDPQNNQALGATHPWWGGAYDGSIKTLTTSQMTNHVAADTFLGYIHLNPKSPTNVVASDGNYAGKVRVTWTAPANTTAYEVWRSTSNNRATAKKISASDVTGTTFDDTTATRGVIYWYFVKAKNASGTSDFSWRVRLLGMTEEQDNVLQDGLSSLQEDPQRDRNGIWENTSLPRLQPADQRSAPDCCDRQVRRSNSAAPWTGGTENRGAQSSPAQFPRQCPPCPMTRLPDDPLAFLHSEPGASASPADRGQPRRSMALQLRQCAAA